MTPKLTAATDACTEFSGWSGGGCSGNQGCVVTMQSHTVVVANFVERDSDGDQIPDCSDPNPDTPDDPADTANNEDGGGNQGAGGGGCFLNSLR